ncbi:response regulator [Limnoglobus roseus]|uniref:Transcriptional regulator n=1 Tax=Limnoglobus roseus TaxID=2598579 RepID=A0A5C1A883_9BACT|nr:response regulator [Limnoglobus roseus]QEL13982.1 transcriptional regulator [Limnoglobus roseus]
MSETVLIVDDEDSVRRTFQEWLTSAGWGVRVFAVADAEAALLIANENPIDLAVLDWNLGSGSDGLRLLEDLVVFTPDIVAILVTGFAHQATPLDALRMGVRDYLDKNQDLNRDAFLAAVRKQLDRIIPAKRQRELNTSLGAFRESVEKVLPLVRASAALNDPVPLPDAVRSLFRFLLRGTGATEGVLIVRHVAADNTETMTVYDAAGQLLPRPTVPFSRSLAASVVSMQEPCVMNDFADSSAGSMELMPFEQNRKSILAAQLRVGPGVQVVLEMFDKPVFTDADRRMTAVAAELGAELLRQGLAEKQTHRLLFDAVESALQASREVSSMLTTPPDAVMESLRTGLDASANSVIDSATGLELLEAVRVLAVRHGPDAVRHCTTLVTSLKQLLDGLSG